MWFEVFIHKSLGVIGLGGMSSVFGAMLDLFWSEGGHNMATGGVALELVDGTPLHIWLRFETLLADEGAIHVCLACKGAAGYRPCFRCRNVYLASSPRAHALPNVPRTSVEPTAVQLHTEATLRTIAGQR